MKAEKKFIYTLPIIPMVVTVVIITCILSLVDLTDVPAFRSIQMCFLNDYLLSFFYKVILAANLGVPILLAFSLKPTVVFSGIKHVFSSFSLFLVALLGLFIGIPVDQVDGAAVLFSSIYCGSFIGAIIVLSAVGMGTLFCILYFFYSCKCLYLLKVKGE